MFPTSKSPKSPAASSSTYDAQIATWVKVQCVLNGTEAMRGAGRLYLPQHAEESNAAYTERLSRNTLFNKSDITLSTWVGKPFSEPLKPDPEQPIPEAMTDLLDNVDLMGNNLDVFARRWFRDGMAKAFSHVLVDFPRVATEAQLGRPRSLADDRAENVRPYWVHLTPEQVFFAEAEMIEGRERLKEVRLFEIATERVGFALVEELQIRRLVLQPSTSNVLVEIYRQNKKAKREEEKWRLEESYTMAFDEIPLVTFYADRCGFMEGKSPLEDLVDLNIAHWQSTSDQRAVLTVARFPMLALSGGTDDDNKLRIGPHEWLYSPDPQAKFYYVEHSGKSIEAGRKDLEDLERQMDAYGAQYMQRRPGGQTATARALDSSEASSPLQDAVLRFQDAVAQALDLTAKWIRLDSGGRVTMLTDFEPDTTASSDLTILTAARKNRDISQRTYLSELQRRGALDEELDLDQELGRLEEEAMSMVSGTGPNPEGGNGENNGAARATTVEPEDEDPDDEDEDED